VRIDPVGSSAISWSVGGKRAVLREEHEVSRKAIAQGRPECSSCPVCSCAVLFAQIARETAGAASTWSSLRPRFRRGQTRCKPRAISAARIQNYIHVICERREAIHLSACRAMDCFAALAVTWREPASLLPRRAREATVSKGPPPARRRDCLRKKSRNPNGPNVVFCNATKSSTWPLLTGNGNSVGLSVLVHLACKPSGARARAPGKKSEETCVN